MRMHDLGPDRPRAALFIHPMLSSGEALSSTLRGRLPEDVRILAPDLAAHGDAAACSFRSAQAEAAEIHAYLVDHGIAELSLAFGASVGGVVLLELLRFDEPRFGRLVFEGTSLFERAPLLEALAGGVLAPIRRLASGFPEFVAAGLARMYRPAFGASTAAALASIDEESFRGIVRDCANVRLPSLPEEVQRRCLFCYGSKEFNRRRARKVLPRKYPLAAIRLWDGTDHCEYMAKNPGAYGQMLRGFLEE